MAALSVVIDTLALVDYIHIGDFVIAPLSLIAIGIASFLGACFGHRFFFHSALALYSLFHLFVVHILYRITENAHNAPTYMDVLVGTLPTLVLSLGGILAGVILSHQARQRYQGGSIQG